MTQPQLTKLLSLYKKAVKNELTVGEFVQEVQDAKIQIDRSFAKNGKEDMNLGEYLEELNQLREFTNE